MRDAIYLFVLRVIWENDIAAIRRETIVMAVRVAMEGTLGSGVGRDALRAMALRFHQVYVTPTWTLPPLRGLVARSSWPVCPPTDSEVLRVARSDGARSESRRGGSGALKRLREDNGSDGDVVGK